MIRSDFSHMSKNDLTRAHMHNIKERDRLLKAGWSVKEMCICVACYHLFLWMKSQLPPRQNRCPDCVKRRRFLV